MPTIEETLADLLDRQLILEEDLAKLKRGRGFTVNPNALATDLDDLGSVKTHLDYEEAPLTPVNPPAEVGRLFGTGRTNANDTTLRYLDKDGNISEVTHAPTVRVFHGSGQTATHNTWKTLTWDSENFDTDDMHRAATQTRLIATTPGVYLIVGNSTWVSDPGSGLISILQAGTTELARVQHNSGVPLSTNITTIFDLTAEDYVELRIFQTSGGDLATTVTNTSFSMSWLCPTP